MIPRLQKRGTSFKEALNYVLHDVNSQTAERVGWTLTRNLVSQVDDAWFEMFETYRAQDALKAGAGVDARGRKNTRPVLHYSLSWQPGQDPTQQHMQETALASLAALGLSEHEAVIVGHDDHAHPHLHIVVNTVHPYTGRTADLSFGKMQLSRWAQAYELEHGIVCEARLQHNQDRETLKEQRSTEALELLTALADGDLDLERLPYVPVKDNSPSRPEWMEQKRLAQLTQDVLSSLTRNTSTFSRQDLAREVDRRTQNKEEFDRLLNWVDADPALIRLTSSGDRMTSQEMIDIESDMVRRSSAMSKRSSHPVGQRDISASGNGLVLSAEQQAALDHILSSAALANVVGVAGSGKSTLLGAARAAWQANGYSVRGAA